MSRALLLLASAALLAPLALSAAAPVGLVRDVPDSDLFLPSPAQPCLTGKPDGAVAASWGFEGGAEGWTTVDSAGRQNLWHWTEFKGNGSANDAMLHDGPGRLYYGIENANGGTYNTSRTRNQGEYRSPPLVVPDGVAAIELNTKWHVEWDRAWIIDSMQLGYASAAGVRTPLCTLGNVIAGYSNIVMGYGYYQTSPWGQAILTACEYSLESPQNPCRVTANVAHVNTEFDLAPIIALWEPRYVQLPQGLAGQTIRVSVYFQTGDAIVDDAMGWMVDDVRVVKLA